jgi:uncharacterized protein YukE
MLVSSAGFTDLQNWSRQIHLGLIGSCDDAAAMAGDDDAGHAFGATYDRTAIAVVNGLGRAVAQLGGTANGLYGMAMDYIRTDADVAASLMRPYELPSSSDPQCEQDPRQVSLPSAVGHNNWFVRDVIAKFWPQADPGKLRQAARDWQKAAELINSLGSEGDRQVQPVTASCRALAVDAFAANWRHMYVDCAVTGPLLNTLSTVSHQLAAACGVFAAQVDKLRTHLEHLAEIAGGVAVVGVGLTFFTLGISDAAGAVGEGAIAAEAAAAATAMTAELSASAELAVLAEAAATVDAAAADLIPVTDVSLGAAAYGSASATMALTTMSTPVPGVIGPIPPDPTSRHQDLTPAEQAEFRAWMARMNADGHTMSVSMPPPVSAKTGRPTKPQVIDARAYQLRVAGDTEYSLYTTLTNPKTGGQARMNADGVRPQDGAAIDAKYVNQQSGCSTPYRMSDVSNTPDFLYKQVESDQKWEMQRYASAINDPRNRVNHLEIDTNDPKAAAYFEAMREANRVPGQTRVVP